MALIFLALDLVSAIGFPFLVFLLPFLLKADMEARPLFKSFPFSPVPSPLLLPQHVNESLR